MASWVWLLVVALLAHTAPVDGRRHRYGHGSPADARPRSAVSSPVRVGVQPYARTRALARKSTVARSQACAAPPLLCRTLRDPCHPLPTRSASDGAELMGEQEEEEGPEASEEETLDALEEEVIDAAKDAGRKMRVTDSQVAFAGVAAVTIASSFY
eukprot:3175040-Prymnesium_polylepis.1